MSSILSAIHDDIQEYEWLCKRYNEKPHCSMTAQGINLIDPYCKHADKLKKLHRERNKSR